MSLSSRVITILSVISFGQPSRHDEEAVVATMLGSSPVCGKDRQEKVEGAATKGELAWFYMLVEQEGGSIPEASLHGCLEHISIR